MKPFFCIALVVALCCQSCFSIQPLALGPVITYNTQSCKKAGRLEDVLSKFRFASTVMLTGTRFKALKNVPVEVYHVAGFLVIVAGYGDNSNSHGGVAVCLNKKWFCINHIISYCWTTGQVQGRGHCLRGPQRYKEKYTDTRTRRRLGYRIQNSDSTKQIDHIPVQAEIPDSTLDYPTDPDQQMIAWNYEQMLGCVLTGFKRQQFFDEMKIEMAKVEEHYSDAMSRNNATEVYYYLMKSILQAGQTVFGIVTKKKRPEFVKAAHKERGVAIQARAIARGQALEDLPVINRVMHIAQMTKYVSMKDAIAQDQHNTQESAFVFWRTQAKLAKVTAKLKSSNREYKDAVHSWRNYQIQTNYRKRNMRQAWQYIRETCFTQKGSRRRWGSGAPQGQGAPQGGPGACQVFNSVYQKPLNKLHQHNCVYNPGLKAYDLVNRRWIHLGMTSFVDDMANRCIGKNSKELNENVHRVDLFLSRELPKYGLYQNHSKEETVFKLEGDEAQKNMREWFQHDEHNVVKEARYLSPHIAWSGTAMQEVRLRMRAAEIAHNFYHHSGTSEPISS